MTWQRINSTIFCNQGEHTIYYITKVRQKKIICVFPIAWSSKLGSGFCFFETYTHAPSSKITQTCLFLSYYSLLIIWHAVQCFWFQTSIKCTRKWWKFKQSSVYCWSRKRISRFCWFFFFGIKNVGVRRSIGNTHIFLGVLIMKLFF